MPPNLFPNDDSSAAAQAARLLFVNPQASADSDDDNSPIVGITIRIPAMYVARLTVLARFSDISRNGMAQLVLKAGFESIVSLLPSEFVEELDEAVSAEYQL